MVERGGQPRLTHEALAEALLISEGARDDLERHRAPERTCVARYTTPIPPRPISFSILKSPRIEPDESTVIQTVEPNPLG